MLIKMIGIMACYLGFINFVNKNQDQQVVNPDNG